MPPRKDSCRGRRIRDSFYTRADKGLDDWIGRCGTRRKQRQHGYGILVSHAERHHPEALLYMLEAKLDGQVSLASESRFSTLGLFKFMAE